MSHYSSVSHPSLVAPPRLTIPRAVRAKVPLTFNDKKEGTRVYETSVEWIEQRLSELGLTGAPGGLALNQDSANMRKAEGYDYVCKVAGAPNVHTVLSHTRACMVRLARISALNMAPQNLLRPRARLAQ